jgi:hypothetical protein
MRVSRANCATDKASGSSALVNVIAGVGFVLKHGSLGVVGSQICAANLYSMSIAAPLSNGTQ